jgi:predicted ester cyclase
VSNQESFARALACFADPQRRMDYFHFYSNDVIVHGYSGIKPGLENVKQFYFAFWRVFPDAQVVGQDLIEEGDKLVARYTITGTMHEAFMGVSSKGQKIALPGISIMHFRNGLCFERWACSDSMVLSRQIGGVVTTEAPQ